MSKPSQNEMSILWIVGMPLGEAGKPPPEALSILEKSDLWIGESRKVGFGFLKHVPGFRDKEVLFLDGQKPHDRADLLERVCQAGKKGQSIALFSDAGMPIAFDPGKDVLETCRVENFEIRSVPG